MDKKEKELKAIMRDVECTREEAEEIWEIEQKAKANGSNKIYAKSDKPKAKAKREPKVDNDKVELINRLRNGLNLYTTSSGGIENLNITNSQREITFTFGGAEYSVVLTKHRPPKTGA